jgi:hypothetical protein
MLSFYGELLFHTIWCYSDYVAKLTGNKTCKLLMLLLCRRTWNFVLYAYGQANNNSFFHEKAWHYGLPIHSNILYVLLSIVTLTLMCYTIIWKLVVTFYYQLFWQATIFSFLLAVLLLGHQILFKEFGCLILRNLSLWCWCAGLLWSYKVVLSLLIQVVVTLKKIHAAKFALVDSSF